MSEKSSPQACATALASQSASYDNAVSDFLRIAVGELAKLRDKLTLEHFQHVADLITQAEAGGARLHVTGIGKPEYVSGYGAALFASTGTPAYFLHGTECVHGSAGQVVPGDVVIVISNSGEMREMKATVSALKRNGALIVGVSGNLHS